jgi:rare lipoprotein A
MKQKKKIGLLVAILCLTFGLVSAQSSRDIALPDDLTQTGVASYYADAFNGQLTATGDVFCNKAMTAASNSLPLGTVVRVTNLHNKKWVLVLVNDRMNKHNRRTIDLTRKAAVKLGMIHRGTARVRVEVIPEAFYAFFHVSPEDLLAFGQDLASGQGS